MKSIPMAIGRDSRAPNYQIGEERVNTYPNRMVRSGGLFMLVPNKTEPLFSFKKHYRNELAYFRGLILQFPKSLNYTHGT